MGPGRLRHAPWITGPGRCHRPSLRAADLGSPQRGLRPARTAQPCQHGLRPTRTAQPCRSGLRPARTVLSTTRCLGCDLGPGQHLGRSGEARRLGRTGFRPFGHPGRRALRRSHRPGHRPARDRGRSSLRGPRNPPGTDLVSPGCARPALRTAGLPATRTGPPAVTGSHPDLRRAHLKRPNRRCPDIERPCLRSADLRGADVRDTDVRDTDLCRADLCRADLRNADLRNAGLRNAGLCRAGLRFVGLGDPGG
ncbi:pentapeptide repeat-containing protein [Actinoplanes sp. NBRC 103695]|uniref:pentapeptide repeat-containing protein n=1 Tax=Actinoplanes sp. NBRC 103695 TaxID=3032202 RepID=UPI0033301C8B